MEQLILAINPGSTSTKVSLFDQGMEVTTQTIRHTTEEISQFSRIHNQKDFRKQLILEFLVKQNITVADLLAVVGRGGLLKPIPGGTYLVGADMLADLKEEKFGSHASNLGARLAYEIAQVADLPAYIVDPVVVDELIPLARISGLKGIERRSVAHALNQKAVARKVLAQQNKAYEESTAIVVHMGGGTSIGAHLNGKMIDIVNGLDGEGPYTPERTGGLPLMDFSEKMVTEKWTLAQAKKIIAGKGGVYSYLQETDLRKVIEQMQAGDQEARYVLEGMCYQVAKGIGEMATVLKGNVDVIILTGGVSFAEFIVESIQDSVSWIAPVEVVPGEMEMEALAEGALRVIQGKETAKEYTK
ncbi:butyrate kinase [Lacticigenium naphthae]|uniref:butyrate kinase n=1 Tax=Lacticigenium naphthae TaxID=515351 RepID=UPI00041B0EDE|nr:butyrate kinase [Lacticigenium naphthae]